MAVTGIASITYGVDDFAASRRFFLDFGLVPERDDPHACDFVLPEGSRVLLRTADDTDLPPRFEDAPGVRRVCWGVDNIDELRSLAAAVGRDRAVDWIDGATVAFADEDGLPVRLTVWNPEPVTSREESSNAPGRITRLNQLRHWYTEARPKVMQHVVFSTTDPRRAARFYVERLGFRISDIQEGAGVFLRCSGRNEHHNLFWQLGNALRFRHLAFGVESIDEVMIGASEMLRKGWESRLGLGRHRISSTYFYYFECPAGGDAEYSTDTDYLDDSWHPRVWGRAYGHIYWSSKPRDREPAPEMRMASPEDLAL